MITVKKMHYKDLRNDEFLGMHAKFTTFMGGLTDEYVAGFAAAYKASVDKLSDHLMIRTTETVTHTAMRLHAERVNAYVALRDASRPLTTLDDEKSVSLGKSVLAVFERLGSIRNLSQDAATGNIALVLDAFHQCSMEDLSEAGIDRWLRILEKKQADYVLAAANRGEAESSRIRAATLLYRKECIENFEMLTSMARCCAIDRGSLACKNFIDSVNGEISMRKEQLRLRKENAKKKREAAEAA